MPQEEKEEKEERVKPISIEMLEETFDEIRRVPIRLNFTLEDIFGKKLAGLENTRSEEEAGEHPVREVATD